MANNDLVILPDESQELIPAVGLEATKEKYEVIEADLNEIQANLTNTAEKLKNQIPTLIDLAEAAQNDKIYNALAKVIDSYTNINKEAANIVKQKQALYDSFRQKNVAATDTEDKAVTVINNDNRTVQFTGTPTDLLDIVHSKRGKQE